MRRLFEIFYIYVAIGALLNGANRAFSSFNQLARRARVSDDKLRRALAALSGEAGDPLVEVKGRRLVLTHVGRNVFDHTERLLAVFRGRSEADPVEVLAVAVADGIDPSLLTGAVQAFFGEWGGLLTLQFQQLDPETLGEGLRSGSIAFAIGWDGEDAIGSVERLEPGLSYCVLVPVGHPLAHQEGPITTDLLKDARIFLPPVAVSSARLAALLAGTSAINRVEVDSHRTARALAAAGLGIALDLSVDGYDRQDENEPFRRLPVAGIEREHCWLYLPRNTADLSEPAKFLIAAFRDLIRGLPLPLPIPLEEPLIESLPEIPPLPTKPLPA